MTETKYIYHAKRYWVQAPTGNQHRGWNSDFVPCPIFKVTAKRIGILSPDLGILYLNREELDKHGKVYHSKPHEYFYKVKPLVDPESPLNIPNFLVTPKMREALSFLGLSYPATKKAIDSAYKAKAKKYHPDKGGSHEDFLRLRNMYRIAHSLEMV